MLKEEDILELERIIKRENSSLFIIFFIIFLILVLFISLSYYFKNAELDIIAETQGTVIPSSKVKTIQHLEGGIVKKIFFNSGDVVNKGDRLIELEPIKTLADFSEIEKILTASKSDFNNSSTIFSPSATKKPDCILFFFNLNDLINFIWFLVIMLFVIHNFTLAKINVN